MLLCRACVIFVFCLPARINRVEWLFMALQASSFMICCFKSAGIDRPTAVRFLHVIHQRCLAVQRPRGPFFTLT
ncbi:hypothetical protein EDB89DRAFT_1175812 [Lactarius sanguifluus]|nr:hypothetical protein EDB89DRAFT_1175812 [Lactarius sanguifluus]